MQLERLQLNQKKMYGKMNGNLFTLIKYSTFYWAFEVEPPHNIHTHKNRTIIKLFIVENMRRAVVYNFIAIYKFNFPVKRLCIGECWLNYWTIIILYSDKNWPISNQIQFSMEPKASKNQFEWINNRFLNTLYAIILTNKTTFWIKYLIIKHTNEFVYIQHWLNSGMALVMNMFASFASI